MRVLRSFLQALVRERMEDWGRGLCKVLGKKLVELTGDVTPDIRCDAGLRQSVWD